MRAQPYAAKLTISDFSMRRPQSEITREGALDWLADVHTAAEERARGIRGAGARAAFRARLRKVLERCACGPEQLHARGHVCAEVGSRDFDAMVVYDLGEGPLAATQSRGARAASDARTDLYASVVDEYFRAEYPPGSKPPADLIHVTCTGYVAPSGAQRLVEARGWSGSTRVTHAYHMGCYAALPALRMAAGFLVSGAGDHALDACVDIVHTELCSLHLDPLDHRPEQLVVQSLFGDGLIRYRLRRGAVEGGLSLVADHERIVPGTLDAMSWTTHGSFLRMTLARDLPEHIARAVRPFVEELCARAGRDVTDIVRNARFAVHPGGPRILDRVQSALELDDVQLHHSRSVLRDFGNMSSATLPHVWLRLCETDEVASGTYVVSIAFGPGVTVCGALLQKT